MSGWLYEDKPHDSRCECDACDGHVFIERHVPDDCLFDDEDRHHRYRDNAKQRR